MTNSVLSHITCILVSSFFVVGWLLPLCWINTHKSNEESEKGHNSRKIIFQQHFFVVHLNQLNGNRRIFIINCVSAGPVNARTKSFFAKSRIQFECSIRNRSSSLQRTMCIVLHHTHHSLHTDTLYTISNGTYSNGTLLSN